MTRYLIAAAVAGAGLFGSTGEAKAQFGYGYSTFVPGTGVVVSGSTYATPFGAQTVTGYYSPYTGMGARQAYYSDVFGGQAARVSGYNPWTNLGYRAGYSYGPGAFGPYANRYGYFYRR